MCAGREGEGRAGITTVPSIHKLRSRLVGFTVLGLQWPAWAVTLKQLSRKIPATGVWGGEEWGGVGGCWLLPFVWGFCGSAPAPRGPACVRLLTLSTKSIDWLRGCSPLSLPPRLPFPVFFSGIMGALCGLMSLLRGPEAGSSSPAATGGNESKIRPGSGPHHSKAPPGIRGFKAPWEFGYFISKVVCISKVAIEAGAGRRLRGGGARASPPLGTPCQAPGSFPPTRPDFSPVRSISSKQLIRRGN